jgi:DNA-binding beta-propeller fold protein YncE
MIKNMLQLVISCTVLMLALASCNDTPQAPEAVPDTGKINDTLYIPIQPDWTDFNEPSDICIGREPFVYVADTKNNRIVMLDIAGRRVGSSGFIKNPVAIAQDGLFDLLVCGELDTLLQGKTVTIGAIYRIHLSDVRHSIANAPIQCVYTQASRPERRYTGIAVLQGNSYLISRTGPSNASRFDPDDAVILMNPQDTVMSRLSSLVPEGNALYSIGSISSLSVSADRSQDFLFTQIAPNMQYKVQWLSYVSADVTGWFQKFNPADPSNSGNDLISVGRFNKPEDITYDSFGNVYVIDAGKDSVLKFTSNGKEMHSFGGTGSGKSQFSSPSGIAWFNKTLYVADTKNNRICRFRLSTDQ